MNGSILTPLHRAAGAELTQGEPALLLAYGDVPAEYRAGLDGCALFDRSDRGLVEVRGRDAAGFLHRLLANDVRSLPPGSGNRNLLLSGKGKVRFEFDLFVEPERILLSVEPGRAAELVQALDVYLFSEDVQLVDRTDDHAPIALCGPGAAAVAARVAHCDPPAPPGGHGFVDGTVKTPSGEARVRVTALPVAGSAGLSLDAGPEHAERLWRAAIEAGAVPAGLVAFDCLRVEAGVAAPGVDVDENVYPQEARLESAFSLEKGCYIGQEVVAKIDTYGGLNKRIVALRVDGDDPVPRGTRLLLDEDGEARDLGVVTSWAYSFTLDTGLVLAYAKRRHQTPGTTFRLGDLGVTGTIVDLPVRAGTLAPRAD